MAAAKAVVTIGNTAPARGTDVTERSENVYGSIAVDASPATYTAGGIACTFNDYDQIKSQAPPYWAEVKSQRAAGSGVANMYLYNYLPGTTQANGFLQIFTGAAAQTAPTELTDGAAIPSGVSGDTIRGLFVFAKV